MFRISCFSDEISTQLEAQLEVMKELGIKYLELRTVWEKNVLQLTLTEIRKLKAILDENGLKVSSIGSPIGKVDLDCDFEEHLTAFHKAIAIAKILETPYIRIFSFYLDDRDLDACREKVMVRMEVLLGIAKNHDITLLLENEAGIYGEASERIQDIYETMNDARLRGVIDPSNYVVAGEEPFESLKRVHRYIEYVHIKDSIKGTGEIVMAGKGDGQMELVLDFLRYHDRMFVSLEPHLSLADTARGFSGVELFKADYQALAGILNKLNIAYE